MELKDFATIDENGALALDNDSFTKSLNSYVDSAVSKAVETAKTNWEKKTNEAKMSEQEKFVKEKEDFATYKQTEMTNINREKARTKLSGKNFTEDEINVIISNITDNADTLNNIDVFVSQRDKVLADYKQKIIEEMQTKKDEKPVIKPQIQQLKQEKSARSREDILNLYKK
jgi:hypothetical protein